MKKKLTKAQSLIFFSLSVLFCTSVLCYPYLIEYLNKPKETLKITEEIPKPYEDYKNKEVVTDKVMGTSTYTLKGYVKIPVLMYHQIGPMPRYGSKYYKGLYVTPSAFESQMKYLVDHNYHTLTPTQFYNYLKAGKTPSKAVLLTFDDGSKGQYQYAYPILKKYHLTATFYMISDRSPITTNQMKRMAREGMVIDSHSSIHEDLKALNSRSQIKYEVDTSKKHLEYVTGKKIVSIAYPGCVADSAVFNQVVSSGYLLGFSCGTSIYHKFQNRLYLSRIHVFSNMYSFTKALTIGL